MLICPNLVLFSKMVRWKYVPVVPPKRQLNQSSSYEQIVQCPPLFAVYTTFLYNYKILKIQCE